MNLVLQTMQSSVSRFAENVAIDDGFEKLSYEALWERTNEFRHRFLDLVNNERSRVAIYMPNSSNYVVGYFGLLAAKCTPMLVDRACNKVELNAISNDCGVTYFLVDANQADKFPLEQTSIVGRPCDGVALIAVLNKPARLPAMLDDTVACRFTSGSSGVPKCLEFSDAAIVSAAETWALGTKLSERDRILCIAALSNGLAFNTSLLATFMLGAELHLYKGIMMASRVLDAIVDREITRFVGFPAIYQHLVTLDEDQRVMPKFLNLAISASASLAPEVRKKFFQRFGVDISDYYGIAETGPVTFETEKEYSEGLGRVLPGVQIRIRSDRDDIPGQIEVRTKYRASRYLNQHGLFESRLTPDGFYKSDDVGEIINDRLYLRGNSNKTANIGGRNVQISEVKSFIEGMTNVAEAEVFVDQDYSGQDILHAAIVSIHNLTRQDVVLECRKNLAAFKVPTRITFVPELPRSGVGKITLSSLKQLVENQALTERTHRQEEKHG